MLQCHVSVTVDGKLEDGRPSLLAKLLPSGSVPELGHSSSSEGEKEFAPPEWDVPLSKNSIRKSTTKTMLPYPVCHRRASKRTFACSPHAEADSLQQISLQTLNADPFLKRSATAGTCSPPPTSPILLLRGSYSSVLNTNRYPPYTDPRSNAHLWKFLRWKESLICGVPQGFILDLLCVLTAEFELLSCFFCLFWGVFCTFEPI